ncbi:3-hydroxyacyl-ACP dehydratase FabZ family protein [Microbaculum marinisediminis]|uniref:Beta-hydroxyacyl-ACP dehydratase n=1 Tax=Microbaculum marinisediminis TaxID=2931392 RepID=A0AAW5QVF6_9HYPH|nr:3-hydroxyacyl-ACP dehydratase FabZ family protein [Microbaculum sp. A6E488]MCT8971658.1 beta-hydroxyacyl-ACP dehydratase [Microbaculum sp. A6E488]
MRIEYFQLIDEIVEVGKDAGMIRARATVPEENTIFEGHFPGHPLMPGVLLIESMAQTSGYLVLSVNGFNSMPFLAGVREAKFRTFVTPGDVLDLEAVLEHDGSGYAMTKAKIKRDGKPICDARLTFRVMPFPTPDFRTLMTGNAIRLGYPQELIA